MASLTQRNGSRVLQFTHAGRRLTCTLGPVSKSEAEHVRLNVTRAIECQALGIPADPDLAAWLARTSGRLRETLAKAGVCGQAITLREYLGGQQTAARQRVTSLLLSAWGESTPVQAITPHHGQQFAQSLTGAENTIRGKIATARSLMRQAVKNRLIPENPFEGIPTAQKPVLRRRRFVTREEIDAVIEQCCDPELRLIVALGRYAGLRIPSELRQLHWSDVDWEHQRFTVSDTKRSCERIVPVFPELSEPFAEAFEGASPGTDKIVHRYRDKPLDRILKKLIKRAGLTPWPKPWHNLRASRETELLEHFPIHVAAAWIGNSPEVCLKHYAMVREADYVRAASSSGMSGNLMPNIT